MSQLPLTRGKLGEAFAALKKDLIHEGGPRISTMRNYRFAILPYDPRDEFKLRAEVQRLTSELKANGWVVLPISLQGLLLAKLKAQGDDWVERVIAMEKRIGKGRNLEYLKQKIVPLVEGPDGIAADCAAQIRQFAEDNPDRSERTLALIVRGGALYPFLRTSALLKHLDGKTNNVPVVLLYPGERRGPTALSFMGIVDPDADYRPRIYP